MSFAWPAALLLLLVIPLLVAIHYWFRRRRRKFAVHYSSLSLIRDAVPKRSRMRRFLPPALFLAGVAALVIAAARPQATVEVPLNSTSIILTLDVSSSMCANDVEPNRLTVAQEVARSFVESQPMGTRIGLVAFAGQAQLIVEPTSDKEPLIEAIGNLTTSRGTAIGSALLEGIDAIAAINPEVVRSGVDAQDLAEGDDPTPADDYQPDIVVLLTDGAATQGVDPIVAAQQAVDRRIRVYTIGFGTTEPSESTCSSDQVSADGFGAGFGGGGGPGGAQGQVLQIDEPTLEAIADMTGGSYHLAEDAAQLEGVFAALPADVSLQEEYMEIGFAFAAVGALAAIAAIGLSLLWNRYP